MPDSLPVIISAGNLLKASSYFVGAGPPLQGGKAGFRGGGRALEYDSTKYEHINRFMFTHFQN